MRSIVLLIAFALSTCVYGQALPPLPDLPSPSPAKSPSPLPSALNDIVHGTPTPVSSPSPATPTAVPPGSSPSTQTSTPTATPKPTGDPNTPQPSSTPGVDDPPPSSPSQSPSPVPTDADESGVCVRDISKPRPVLGKSQLRYAVSVLLSAAAVGLASLFYGWAAEWDPTVEHTALRVCLIVLARLLTIGSVKVSAALVAAITKASPDDGALDASGAFLTWGTAIFTRLYYEGFRMTMVVLDFSTNECVWDDELKEFFAVLKVRQKVLNVEGETGDITEGTEGTDTDGRQDMKVIHAGGGVEYVERNLSLFQRIFGGNLERKLFLVTALAYFASEISVLTANVLVLVGAFVQDPDRTNFFASGLEGGQCNIMQKDVPIIVGLLVLQSIYALTQQPSLVPLLTISAFCPDCQRYPTINKILQKLRWIAGIVLLLWVVSLLTLPLFSKPLQPFFTVGDVSLFWYVIIAPPEYLSVSYIITATYSCLAALVGAYIIYGIAKSQRAQMRGEEDVEAPASSSE